MHIANLVRTEMRLVEDHNQNIRTERARQSGIVACMHCVTSVSAPSDPKNVTCRVRSRAPIRTIPNINPVVQKF